MDEIMNNEYFSCFACNYNCKKKSSLEKHCLTKKHISTLALKNTLHNNNNNNNNNNKNNIDDMPHVCDCGKGYKHRQSLHSHRKKCVIMNASTEWSAPQVSVDENNNTNDVNSFKEMIVDLMKKNQELQETVIKQQEEYKNDLVSLIPKIGNNNNNNITNNINNKINLNVFLNETCKDALNIDDFMNSLQISFADLEITREKGLIESVNNQIISSLRNMEIEKRPFHCSDQKRRVLHIKDNDEWQRDNNCEKIKSSIDTLAKKQLSNFNMWEKENPNFMNTSCGQEEYMQLVSNITKEVSSDDKGNNKIIGSIAKEVAI